MALTDKQKEFIKVWWEAALIEDVIEHYVSKGQFKGMDKRKISAVLRAKAANFRKQGVPLKYFTTRLKRGGNTIVDTADALSFLKKEMKVRPSELEKAQANYKVKQKEVSRKLKR